MGPASKPDPPRKRSRRAPDRGVHRGEKRVRFGQCVVHEFVIQRGNDMTRYDYPTQSARTSVNTLNPPVSSDVYLRDAAIARMRAVELMCEIGPTRGDVRLMQRYAMPVQADACGPP